MSDIRQWLEQLGLGQYADAFEENEVRLEHIPDLTHDVLKELDVTVIGHRMTLLKAATTQPENTLHATAETSDKRLPAPRSSTPEAERRQLTVMFCDLVGSTALSEKLDPEDLRGVMTAYRRAADDVVARYDGHVAQYLGDGVMVYFGWPTAHEDDAGRAVRTGLEIVEAVKALDAPVALSVRIGIATGLVVVGADDGAQGDARLAVGETPNIAARVQALAEANTIVIAESTRRLIGGAFELDDLGGHAAKGVSGQLQIHRVVGEVVAESRFEAQAIGGLTPFVGRESEVAMLLDRWEQAKDGEGQVVLLSGEAGIGKSRVTQVLRERLADEPHTRLRYQCSSYCANSAFYPVIAQLERAAGFARDDDADVKLDKLEALLGRSDTETALVAALLSLPIERYPPLVLSPQKQKENTIAAIAGQVTALAASQPVLVIFEDAHWVDPTTLETLGAVIEAIRDHPVLMVITSRPEFESPWGTHAHVIPLTLGRLGRKLGAAMVVKVTGGKTLPNQVLDQIVAKTDGIPLFVEELTKTVLEAGFLKDAGDAYTLDGPLPPLAIPATLQDSLMARLDRLSSIKEVAQIGACIGREFSYELLAAISPLDDNELQEALRQLIDSELIFRRGTPPDATYTFKHALVQDTAYSTILKSKRVPLHGQIAVWLRDNQTGSEDAAPERLAEHYAAAEMPGEAVWHWYQASQNTYDRGNVREAISHLQAALKAATSLPESTERDEWKLKCLLAVGSLYETIFGWASRDAVVAYRHAIALGDKVGDKKATAWAKRGMASGLIWQGETRTGQILLLELHESLVDDVDPAIRLLVKEARSFGLLYSGDWKESRRIALEGRAILDEFGEISLPVGMGFNPGVGLCLNLTYSSWMLGYPDQARTAAEQAIVFGRNSPSAFDLMSALTFPGADIHRMMRDYVATITYASEVRAIQQRQPKSEFYDTVSEFYLANAMVWQDNDESAVDRMRAVLARFERSGAVIRVPGMTATLAEAVGRLGCPEEGLAILAASPDRQGLNAEPTRFAEIWRIEGDLNAACDEPDVIRAEHCLREAIDIARSEEAKSWELRAATSLAHLWRSQGKTQEARDLLAPVYDWFTEGFDTADLKDAKALLEELK